MTSNSRAEQRFYALLSTAAYLLFLSVAGLAAAQEQVPPDAPRLAPPAAKEARRPAPRPARPGTVELKSAVARRVDEKYAKLAGPEFMRTAEAPVYIEVETQAPLGNLARNAALVILLNDERLMNTRAVAADRLIAFLPDRSKIKDTNTIAVVWLGEAAPTKTKRPLTIKREDVGK